MLVNTNVAHLTYKHPKKSFQDNVQEGRCLTSFAKQYTPIKQMILFLLSSLKECVFG